MNISGPVRVEPTKPMTRSNLGTDSPKKTAKATMPDRIRHRRTQKSAKNKNVSNYLIFFVMDYSSSRDF